jgi:hypothetical protein
MAVSNRVVAPISPAYFLRRLPPFSEWEIETFSTPIRVSPYMQFNQNLLLQLSIVKFFFFLGAGFSFNSSLRAIEHHQVAPQTITATSC